MTTKIQSKVDFFSILYCSTGKMNVTGTLSSSTKSKHKIWKKFNSSKSNMIVNKIKEI